MRTTSAGAIFVDQAVKTDFPDHLLNIAVQHQLYELAKANIRESLAILTGLDPLRSQVYDTSERLFTQAREELNVIEPDITKFMSDIRDWIDTLPENQIREIAQKSSSYRDIISGERLKDLAVTTALFQLQSLAEEEMSKKINLVDSTSKSTTT